MARKMPDEGRKRTRITYVAQQPSSNDTKNQEDRSSVSYGKAADSTSTKLVLVPLHPASKRQKLDAKQFPVVLGRTNLAAWWWKSCPCQHYCRLDCRPVAQNIRSLSKIMIQIDTEGRVHIVAKNPHLITITPVREDNVLHVNDIISIGRREREPWMRFQAVQKNSSVQQSTGNGDIRGAKASSTQESTELAESAAPPVHSTFAPLSRAGHRQEAASALSSDVMNQDNTSLPPEWITTNNLVKRKATRESSLSIQAFRCLQRPLSQQKRDINTKVNWKAASSATSARVQSAGRTPSESIAPATMEPAQKRQRCAIDVGYNDGTLKDLSRRGIRGFVGSRKGNQLHRIGGGNDSTAKVDNNNNSSRKQDNPLVHLIFQDFETSASLLQGGELRRREESCINKSTSKGKASSSESCFRNRHFSEFRSPRDFVAGKNQPRLFSRKAAEALLGAESFPGYSTEQNVLETQPNGCVTTESAQAVEKDEATLTRAPLSSHPRGTARSKQRVFSSLSPEVCASTKASGQNEIQRMTEDETKRLVTALIAIKPQGSTEVQAHMRIASVLSLPMCEFSSSLNAGQASIRALSPPEEETYAMTSLQHDTTKEATDEVSMSRRVDTSVSSPSSCDPIMNLKTWQDILEHEIEKGSTSSFRHALASLIIAKNQDRLENSREKSLLWLPPLLGAQFNMESLQFVPRYS